MDVLTLPSGPGPPGPLCLRQGIWNQLRGSGRLGTVTLAEAEALLGQQPGRAT